MYNVGGLLIQLHLLFSVHIVLNIWGKVGFLSFYTILYADGRLLTHADGSREGTVLTAVFSSKKRCSYVHQT